MKVAAIAILMVLGCMAEDLSSPSVSFFAASPLVATSILMAGVPECTLKCGAPLLASIARAYKFPSNALMAFTAMCSEYEVALKCIRESAGSDCQGPNYFDIITSGVKFACEDFRIDFNDLYTALGSRQPGINEECSKLCHISDIAEAFDKVTVAGPGALTRSSDDPEDIARRAQVKKSLDVLCGGVKCVLDCSEKSVDKIIPGFGAVFQKLDRLPWEVVGVHLKQQPESVRQFFNHVMPDTCWALTKPVQIFETSGEASGEASGSIH